MSVKNKQRAYCWGGAILISFIPIPIIPMLILAVLWGIFTDSRGWKFL